MLRDSLHDVDRLSGAWTRRRLLATFPALACVAASRTVWAQGATGVHFSVLEFDRARILASAIVQLSRQPVSLVEAKTATAEKATTHELSSGPDSAFSLVEDTSSSASSLAQIDLLVRVVERTAVLTAAWRLTQEERYFNAAMQQIRVWCIDPETRMEPTLEHVGTSGTTADDARMNGINQTVCLAEFARAVSFLCAAPKAIPEENAALRSWFSSLLGWLNESKRGTIARETKDLQAICWTMQAAEIARFTRNDVVLGECTHRFRDRLLRQMNFDGYFPPALQTKRPYAACMFTLECMASACESLSTPFESQWNSALPDGRGMRSAVAWAYPYLANKGKWPYVSDAQYFGEQPLRSNALLFAGRAWNRQDYIDLWKTMRPDTKNDALKWEHPITQPGLWAMRPPA